MAADRLEKTCELLLQAVESLRDSTSSPPPPAPERNSAPPNASQASGCSERASVIGECNRLFNFVFLKKVGTGGGKRVPAMVLRCQNRRRNGLIRGITISFASPALCRVSHQLLLKQGSS